MLHLLSMSGPPRQFWPAAQPAGQSRSPGRNGNSILIFSSAAKILRNTFSTLKRPRVALIAGCAGTHRDPTSSFRVRGSQLTIRSPDPRLHQARKRRTLWHRLEACATPTGRSVPSASSTDTKRGLSLGNRSCREASSLPPKSNVRTRRLEAGAARQRGRPLAQARSNAEKARQISPRGIASGSVGGG